MPQIEDALSTEQQALKWFTEAAQQGHREAQYKLGLLLLNGQGVSQDLNQALKWVTLSAEQGYAKAQYQLGMFYLNGTGVDVNVDLAIKNLSLAAEQGLVNAQYSLGAMYALGQGIPVDQELASKWLSLAAKQGHVDSQYMLAELLAGDIEDHQDKIFSLLLKACRGDNSAQYQLGLAFEQGQGINSNQFFALNWFNLAAQSGHNLAQSKYQELLARLDKHDKDKNDQSSPQPLQHTDRAGLAITSGTANLSKVSKVATKAKKNDFYDGDANSIIIDVFYCMVVPLIIIIIIVDLLSDS